MPASDRDRWWKDRYRPAASPVSSHAPPGWLQLIRADRFQLEQAALIDWFCDALGRGWLFHVSGFLWFACNRFCRSRGRRPVGVDGGADAAIGKFEGDMRGRFDAGRGMHRM